MWLCYLSYDLHYYTVCSVHSQYKSGTGFQIWIRMFIFQLKCYYNKSQNNLPCKIPLIQSNRETIPSLPSSDRLYHLSTYREAKVQLASSHVIKAREVSHLLHLHAIETHRARLLCICLQILWGFDVTVTCQTRWLVYLKDYFWGT